jgi:hypothetical protein
METLNEHIQDLLKDSIIEKEKVADDIIKLCVKERINGLADKIQEILNCHIGTIERNEKYIQQLEKKIEFCGEHKFEEEKRIALAKWDKHSMTVYNFRTLNDDIQTALNKWNS